MSTFVMFDSVNINNIPKDAQAVAGYINGEWPTFNSLAKKFPNAHRVSISVNAQHVAAVLDVEKGDATAADVPGWLKMVRSKGFPGVVYTSKSNVDAVKAACLAAKVAEPFIWDADWTNVEHLNPGSVATQWADGTDQYPGKAKYCDTSLVSPNFPGFTKPAPKKVTKAVKKVATVTTSKKAGAGVRNVAASAAVALPLLHLDHFSKPDYLVLGAGLLHWLLAQWQKVSK